MSDILYAEFHEKKVFENLGAVSPIISVNSKTLKTREKFAPAPILELNKSITPTKPCVPTDDADAVTEEEQVDDGNVLESDASVGQFIDEKMNPLLEANYRAMLLAKEKELDRLSFDYYDCCFEEQGYLKHLIVLKNL